MIRFVVKRYQYDRESDQTIESFETVDADVPVLESLLSSGIGEQGHDLRFVVGAEVIEGVVKSKEAK